MRKVVIESPLSPSNGRTFEENIKYARLCAVDCLRRKEAPYASHLLMTQFLDDASPEERKLGMQVGFIWGACGEAAVVYEDLGISSGMKMGIELHMKNGIPLEYRYLPADLMAQLDGMAKDIRPTEGISRRPDVTVVDRPLDTCPTCKQKYEHVGHPLKPGVIMMSTCGCKFTTTPVTSP
jgi:hypothetical protein